MKRTKRLGVIGDFAWDALVVAEQELLTGGDTFGQVGFAPGGSAANTAVWARRCGQPTVFIGKVGRDRLGRLAHDNLAEEGLEDYLIEDETHPTGCVAVYINPQGERSMVTGRGADHYLMVDELPDEVLATLDHLHITGWSLFQNPPRDAGLAACQRARANGATVSLDPSSFQLIDEFGVDSFLLLAQRIKPDILFPNIEEGRSLTGLSDPEDVARRLDQLFPEALVVLKLDARGSLVFTDEGPVFVAPNPVTMVDATGAGDCFAGSFLAYWLAREDPLAAASQANFNASWVVQRVGARPDPDKALQARLATMVEP